MSVTTLERLVYLLGELLALLLRPWLCWLEWEPIALEGSE